MLPVIPTSSLRPSTPSSCSPAPAGVWCPRVAEPQVHLPDRTRTLPGRGDPQAESSLLDALILAHPPRLCLGLPGRWSIWKGSFRRPVSLERGDSHNAEADSWIGVKSIKMRFSMADKPRPA